MTIVATLNDGSYAGWGWGSSMDGTEMVIFSANGDSSSVGYYYSTGETKPTADPSFAACYDSSFVNNGDGTVTLTASRPLECSETDLGGGFEATEGFDGSDYKAPVAEETEEMGDIPI